MSDVVFMAPVNAGGGTIYGKDHKATITDEAQVRQWQADGKVGLAAGWDVRGVSASAITATSASVFYTADFPQSAITSHGADYGLTTAYGSTAPAASGSAPGVIGTGLSGLTTNTLYHYRIRVVLTTGLIVSPDYTFRTL